METNRRVIKLKKLNKDYPPYWDEMLSHNARIKGKKRKRGKWQEVYSYYYRRFRTWKHNRRTKYKNDRNRKIGK